MGTGPDGEEKPALKRSGFSIFWEEYARTRK
jgi:hypothetical protein